ncbi:MAG: hypothetical protein AUJ52_00310 [Elusimicrobia bacterium CG1_02_63_36]|nr:MAG: hypothetical protein AUJ52_00310 [Elusimicrobia bacterium CG1_02_63_36]
MPMKTLALAVFLAAPAAAAVDSFETRLDLNADGSMTVQERIEFGAGVSPVREISTRRLLWNGLREVSRVQLVDAIVDGLPIALRSRLTPRGILWTPEEALSGEAHTMILRYRADARVFEGAEADLLIWDATGFHWKAPIQTVSLRLSLPDGVESVNASVLAGKPDALVEFDRRTERASVFKAVHEDPLAPGEGLRLIARLPKGAIAANAPRTPMRKLRDNLHVALGASGALGLLLFVLLERAALRRDPDPDAASPDGPGPDLSYASARYLLDGRYRGRTLQAGVTGLLAKRWLSRFESSEGAWRLARGEGDTEALTPDERVLGESLLGTETETELGGTGAFEKALFNHARVLEGRCAPLIRSRAWTPWACGLAWSAGIVSAMRTAAALFEPVPTPLLPAFAAGALSLLGGFALAGVWTLTYRAWREASVPGPGGRARALPLLLAVGLGFLSFGLVTAAAQGFQIAIEDLSPAALLCGLAFLGVNWWAFYALRGPTREGFDALRRARLLTERADHERFTAALRSTEKLAREADALL